MHWLTAISVRDAAESKVGELRQKIEDRRSVAVGSYEHELIAKAVGESLAAGLALQKEWFCDSVGITWEEGDEETWYISRAPLANNFASDYVVHWTHWLGRLSIQIRDHLEIYGHYPDRLVYGPPNRPNQVLTRDVGPWVRYKFTDGRLVEFKFYDENGEVDSAAEASPAQQPATAEAEPIRPETDVAPVFGLKDIVQLRDLDQDDQIRGPMAGVYILTGGPGVGKTSVALHRIPYLLLQQVDQLPAEVPDARPDFFSVETMQVVVWKEHLVPYLQRCLQDLNYGSVPVLHVEDWVARMLRDYIRIGRGREQYQITPSEPEELRRIKIGTQGAEVGKWHGFTEQMLETYLIGRDEGGKPYNPLADEVVNELAQLASSLVDMFADSPIPPNLRRPASDITPTVGGIESATQAFRDSLEQLADSATRAIRRIRDQQRGNQTADTRPYERVLSAIGRARDAITDVRDRLIDWVTRDYPAVIADFYASKVVNGAVAELFGQEAADRFCESAGERIRDRRLSQCDRYLLLWLIHLITRGGTSDRRQARPLRQYTHTVIDEAQYYHPLVLRLLVELAMPPVRSVTIVGDLEQKVSSEGGLVGWEDAGIMVEAGKIFRLNTNYRWSKAVFAFLDRYRRLTGLRELREPRRWASGAGLTPVVVRCLDEEEEVSWLVDRIADVRRTDWSIAVVVPPALGEVWQRKVMDELASCDIRSRWAAGEDVRECQEQIILTNYESIVGLEFDAVFLPSCDRVLAPPTPGTDAVQAAWVALTRSRQFVAISHIGPIAVFDSQEFEGYRSKTV